VQAFENNDWNGDGVLSGEEVRPGARRNEAVGTSGRVTGLNERTFETLDRNRNGRLERNEWTGTPDQFDRLDANGNNILSRAEAVPDAADSGINTGINTGYSARAREFDELDINADGRLTIQEWNWNRRTFDQQDGNRDGFVTLREFTGAPATTYNFGQ
jgi:hypothetical protein